MPSCLHKTPPLLAAEGVSKRYGKTLVLNGVDLDVAEGEVTCIVGPSGSGKTTLLRCLALLEQPSSGRIMMAGTCLSPSSSARAASPASRTSAGVGMVFQHFNLWPHMTVLGNLIEAPMRVRKLSRAQAVDQAQALLDKVGLSAWRDVYPARLSGGQQQRAAIARALCMKPRVLLFDEPTSALDPEFRHDVLMVIRDLARDGVTMVVVTHEMGFARKVCSRLVFMDRGAVVEASTAQAFFHSPTTERAKRFLAHLED